MQDSYLAATWPVKRWTYSCCSTSEWVCSLCLLHDIQADKEGSHVNENARSVLEFVTLFALNQSSFDHPWHSGYWPGSSWIVQVYSKVKLSWYFKILINRKSMDSVEISKRQKFFLCESPLGLWRHNWHVSHHREWVYYVSLWFYL